MDISPGLFGMIGVVIGASASFCGNWIANRSQERRLKHEIKAAAIESEVASLREAVISVLDQLFVIQDVRTRGESLDDIASALFEFDRRINRLSLYGSVEIINCSANLVQAVAGFCKSDPIQGAQDPRYLNLHKAKTVWHTVARREIFQLRGVTLDHQVEFVETSEMLADQMESLVARRAAMESHKAFSP